MIRLMREEDVGHCVDLGERFHATSYWNWIPYNKEKAYEWTLQGVNNPEKLLLVAEDAPSQTIFGFFVASHSQFWYADASVSEEQVMFVSPEHSGGSTGLKFMRAWERWSKDMGADVMFFNPTSHMQGKKWNAFMKRLGYHEAGAAYRKAIGD